MIKAICLCTFLLRQQQLRQPAPSAQLRSRSCLPSPPPRCGNEAILYRGQVVHPLYCPGLGLATQCQEEEQGQLTLTVAQVWQSSQFRILVIGVNLAMNMCYCLPSLLPRSHWQPGGRKNLQRLGPTVAQVRQLTEFVQEILVYFEATMCLSQHCLTSTCCPGQAGISSNMI